MKNHKTTTVIPACLCNANPHPSKIHTPAPRLNKGWRNAGFGLVEVMITLLVIAVLSGVALTSFGISRESSSQIAVQGDAIMINKAIQAYIAGGGSLEGITDPNDVLAKLKTKPLATQEATIAGTSGPFVDLRLELKPATSGNPVSLIYHPEKTSFKMVTGSAGVVTNVNEELAKVPIATEDRHVSLALATEDKWVWDYADVPNPARPPAFRPLEQHPSPPPSSTPAAFNTAPLTPPKFSIPGSQLGPLDYPKTVTLTHGNPAGAAELFFRVNGGEWSRYTAGITLPIAEAVKIESYADTLSPDDWSASAMAVVAFTFKPGQLIAPTISPIGGKFKYDDFPTTLNIVNPNMAGTSRLEYKVGTGAWTTYTSPIILTPDTTVAVSSRAVPIDSRLWITSDTASATYELLTENLLAPFYSKAAGSYPALQYPLTVVLTNPNPTGSSTLQYRQLNGTWQAYISPITLAATQLDVTLEARAVTTDAKRWVTSPTAQSRYVLTRLAAAAQPTTAVLWPPNHGFVAVGITGVTDPNNNAIIKITGVTQDEATNGLGDGDTPIDAVIRADGTVLLRAERSGSGDGRVYRVYFTASDLEVSSSGVVLVKVPHSKERPAIDSGGVFKSTQ